MSMTIHLLPPKLSQQFKRHPFASTTFVDNRVKTQIQCSKNSNNDAKLASDFAKEVVKLNTQFNQGEEAMKKSKELLFKELCDFLSSNAEEVKQQWRKMDEEEKMVLVKGFVSNWGMNFQPLSAKSVKELVEEYLNEENPSPNSDSTSALLPNLKKFMGFP